MKKCFKATAGIVSLILMMSLLFVLFVNKDNKLRIERVSQNEYQHYLVKKLNLIQYLLKDKNQLCEQYKKEKLKLKVSGLIYQFSCKNENIFVKEPTTKKYVSFTNIQDFLDVNKFEKQIIHIKTLNDLPKTSSANPSIVIAENEIDGRLKRNFYGIIITDHYFDITGKKFYGKLYSSYDNKREERNLSYSKTVIKNLKKKFGKWTYMINSQYILNENEE